MLGVSKVVATLWGSCDPGGVGVSGDGGAAGIGPLFQYISHGPKANVIGVTELHDRI